MHRQAQIAWLIVLLQAGMFWCFSETIVFPILIVLIASPAVWWQKRWEFSLWSLPWIDLALALGCALQWNLAPYEPPTMTTFLNYPMVHAAGRFFLLAQVARLWVRRPDRPLPMYLPLLAVLVFVCLGDVQLYKYGGRSRMYQRATLALVGLSCAFYSVARRRQEPHTRSARWVRPTVSVAVLVVCVVGTRTGSSWLLEKWSDLDQWLLKATGARAPQRRQNLMIGFSGQAPLGSMQLMRTVLDQEIALRVISDRPPGYLRGAVFERYTSRGWDLHSDWTPIDRNRYPVRTADRVEPPPSTPSRTPQVFSLREGSVNRARPVSIWRAPSMDRFTFLPLATSRLEATTDVLNFDRHSVVSAENMPSEVSLTAWVSETSGLEPIIQPKLWEPGTTWELDRLETLTAKVRLRQLPPKLAENPKIQQLAARVFADCKTPQDKVAAVQRFFAKHRYATSIEIPPQEDPMLHFLLEQPPAHCEYFASATAVLLRMVGIPCRYVTGYAGGEYNVLGEYWVLRQRDAHAWVEAYLPETGWVIVDSTPSGHTPETTTTFGFWQLWDELTLRGQMIRTALAGESWSGKWFAVKLFFRSLVTTIPGILVAGGLLFLAVRNLRFTRRTTASRPIEPALIELQRLLAELDQLLRRLHLERDTHETLHQFADRLRVAASSRPMLADAAEWYLCYAATRYGTPSFQAEAPDVLRTELVAVCAQLTK